MEWLLGLLSDFVRWTDKYYAEHGGVTNFAGLVVAVLALLVGLPGAVGAIWPTFFSKKPRERPTIALRKSDRATLLNQIDTNRIRPVLRQGLRREVRLDVKLTEVHADTNHRAITDRTIINQLSHGSLITEDVFGYFKHSGRMLWILGEPGTGKTNLLLELAENLIHEAIAEPEMPIPVVLSLARWATGERDRSLEEWICDDLQSIYLIGADAADTLVKTGGIIPLLDGLDEVLGDRRTACITEINSFLRKQDVKQFAICCRLMEFEETLSFPRIGRVLKVEKLTEEELAVVLARPELESVRRALIDAPELVNAVRTPLWLNILSVSANSMIPKTGNLRGLGYLYDCLLNYALSQDPVAKSGVRTVSRDQLLESIGWLASALRNRGQIQFAVEDLDGSWIKHTKAQELQVPTQHATEIARQEPLNRVTSIGGPTLLARLGFGLPIGVAGWWTAGVVFGVVAFVVASIRIEGRFESSEELRLQWKEVARRARASLAYGAIAGIAVATSYGAISGMCIGLITAVFEVLQAGFRPRAVSRSAAPNYRTMRSLRYAVRVLLIGAMLSGAFMWSSILLSSFVKHGNPSMVSVLRQCSLFIVFATIILAGEKGGWFVLRHYFVRLCLHFRGSIPWSLLPCLEEASNRNLLIRRGGTFEFMHVTLRDHLADIYSRGQSGGTLSERGHSAQNRTGERVNTSLNSVTA